MNRDFGDLVASPASLSGCGAGRNGPRPLGKASRNGISIAKPAVAMNSSAHSAQNDRTSPRRPRPAFPQCPDPLAGWQTPASAASPRSGPSLSARGALTATVVALVQFHAARLRPRAIRAACGFRRIRFDSQAPRGRGHRNRGRLPGRSATPPSTPAPCSPRHKTPR